MSAAANITLPKLDTLPACGYHLPIMTVEVTWAGCLDYALAWEKQKTLVAALSQCPEREGDLLLLEHPPTYTLGRNGHRENLLLDETALQEQGIAFYHVDRGGDITYHCPGQLVGYPILNLKRIYTTYSLGLVRRYVHDLEELIIRAIAPFGLMGQRHEAFRGVWIETGADLAKIAAVGVRISSGGITSHGFALNVAPNMRHFTGIIPCGLEGHAVTSMAELLPHPVTMAEVLPHVISAFSDVFNCETEVRQAEFVGIQGNS